jgi:hypothetical protein
MRTTDLSSTLGVGGWGIEGKAAHVSWSSHLLAVGDDTPNQRTHGWQNGSLLHLGMKQRLGEALTCSRMWLTIRFRASVSEATTYLDG